MNWWESYYANIKLDDYDVRTQPFYLLYGGYNDSGFLYDIGSIGGYWSSTADSSAVAYNLDFNPTNGYPSNANNRYRGFSIRCLAR